jgi:endonuclease/exonuclease/phosphatase (EEP) superfamily protein YafD
MKAFLKFLSVSLIVIILLCVLPAFLLTITAFLGALDWRLDLTSHFRPWYLIIEIVALFLFAILQKKRLALCTLIFLILNTIPLLPLYLKPASSNHSGIRFKLIQFNVCAPAKDYAPLSHYLSHEKPDLVVMEECADRCVNHLKRDEAWKQYPYQFRKVPYRHRLVVLSKFPIKAVSTPDLPADPAVSLLTLDVHHQPINLFIMHSTRPSSGSPYYKNQIEQFKQIAQLAVKNQLPFLMVGDLNVSPWNYSFGLLLRESHLKNSMDGFGFQPSFPTFVPHFDRVPVFPVIPIDHVLVSRHFSVLNRHTGPRLQSDHLPLIVELGLHPGT